MSLQCKKCGGVLAPRNDKWGWYLSCWRCGRTIELKLKEPRVVNPGLHQEGDKRGLNISNLPEPDYPANRCKNHDEAPTAASSDSTIQQMVMFNTATIVPNVG